jgi:hypothetical protein
MSRLAIMMAMLTTWFVATSWSLGDAAAGAAEVLDKTGTTVAQEKSQHSQLFDRKEAAIIGSL